MISSQCVPSWEVEDPPNSSHHHLLPSSSAQALLPMLDYNKVAELTWQNGQVSAHGLVKPTTKYPTFALGTLKSIVDQAKLLHPADMSCHYLSASNDALVPTHYSHRHHREIESTGIGSSCNADMAKRKKARVEEGPLGIDGGGSTNSKGVLLVDNNNNDTTFCGTDDLVSGDDTENTSIGGGDGGSGDGGSRVLTLVDEHDSVCHSRGSLSQVNVEGEDDEKVSKEGIVVRSTVSTKRSRAAVIHDQSERTRRDKINQRMRTLQKLVPNSDKTDKASVLDEVIGYMKQLQAQVQMMKSMSSTITPMMMPIGMQQYQMAMMAQMGMGMGMMDMASLGQPGPAGISPVIPTSPAFLPVIGGSWDHSIERMQALNGGVCVMPDPFSSFGACPTQQAMSMDAHQRMAALYQQQMFQQSKSSTPK